MWHTHPVSRCWTSCSTGGTSRRRPRCPPPLPCTHGFAPSRQCQPRFFTAEFPVYLSHFPGYLEPSDFCQALWGIHFIPENLLFMASSLFSSPCWMAAHRCTVILFSFAAFGGAFSSPVTDGVCSRDGRGFKRGLRLNQLRCHWLKVNVFCLNSPSTADFVRLAYPKYTCQSIRKTCFMYFGCVHAMDFFLSYQLKDLTI